MHAKTMAAWASRLEALALDPRRSGTPLRPSLYVPIVRQVKAYLNRCGLPEEILFPPPYLAAHHNELADMGKMLLGPKVGLDFAGLVRQVGDGVSKFAVGDEVYGTAAGSLAEYVRGC